MRLKYVVLTSVNRDDLADGGASHFAACVREIKQLNPATAVEALTPDFQGVLADVETVVGSGLDVFAQNVETVRRLTHPVRDPRAGYEQTLQVLAHAKRFRPDVLTKTSLMLGLGETDEEIAATMDDIRAAGVDLAHARSVSASDGEPPGRSSAGSRRRSSSAIANGRSRKASSNASPGRWCARAIAPSARSNATTQACAERIARCGLHPMRASCPTAPHADCHPLLKWLGRVEYEPTWRAMQAFTEQRGPETPDEIWFLEHPPVFTLGMNAAREHVLAPGDIPVGADRSRRPGHLSRSRSARGLSAARCAPSRARRAAAGDGAGERASSRCSHRGTSRRSVGAMRPVSTSKAASSPASDCGSAAAAVIMASRSTSRWTWSRFAASIRAATAGWK